MLLERGSAPCIIEECYMRPMNMTRTLLCALLLVFSVDTSIADPVVWLDDNVNLHGRTIYVVSPVHNETGKTFNIDVTSLIRSEMIQTLRKEGMIVLYKQDASRDSITIDSRLGDYGAEAQRNVGCFRGRCWNCVVVRTILIDDKSGKTLGEIIDSSSVSAGGLFSIGAEKSLPKNVAHDIARKIIEMVQRK